MPKKTKIKLPDQNVPYERQVEIFQRLIEICAFEADAYADPIHSMPCCIEDFVGEDYNQIKKERVEYELLKAELYGTEPKIDEWTCRECGGEIGYCPCTTCHDCDAAIDDCECEYEIFINAQEHVVIGCQQTYEAIRDLAGYPSGNPSMLYHDGPDRNGKREGLPYPGKKFFVTDGMHFSCMYTGNA